MSGSAFSPPFSFPFGGPPPVSKLDQAKEDIFGKDIFFNGNLQLTPAGDYQTISGIENLRASILRRLATNPGEYGPNPSYGVGLFSTVKKPMTKALIDTVKHRIVDQLSQDRRIDKVQEVNVTQTFLNNRPGLEVIVSVLALGRDYRFQPFTFNREPG